MIDDASSYDFTLGSSETTVMDYWIMKARRAAAVVAEWVQEDGTDTWWTKRRPSRLKRHDRLFVWKGGASPFLIGVGECLAVYKHKDRAGRYTFRVRYLTDAFEPKLTIERLRRDPILKRESFLKVGPSGTLFSLTPEQGRYMDSLIQKMHLATAESLEAPNEPSSRSIPDLDVRTTGERIRERKLRAHVRKERSEALRKARLASARQKGEVRCEVCGLAFGHLPREIGEACCEVHHTIPVSSLASGAMVRLRDLAVVCSNCHRMIHAKNPPLALAHLRRELSSVRS